MTSSASLSTTSSDALDNSVGAAATSVGVVVSFLITDVCCCATTTGCCCLGFGCFCCWCCFCFWWGVIWWSLNGSLKLAVFVQRNEINNYRQFILFCIYVKKNNLKVTSRVFWGFSLYGRESDFTWNYGIILKGALPRKTFHSLILNPLKLKVPILINCCIQETCYPSKMKHLCNFNHQILSRGREALDRYKCSRYLQFTRID